MHANKKNSSIFTHILAATLLPLIAAFAFVIVFVSGIVRSQNDASVRDTISFTARHVSEKVTDSLAGINGLIKLTAMNMAEVAADSEESRGLLEKINHSLMDANLDINCAWHVFAEGVVSSEKGWYARSFLRKHGVVTEIPAVEQLDDPEISAWHVVPFSTGRPYQDTGGYWDYGINEDPEYIATVAYPIVRGGEIIGSVGMDITYAATFALLDSLQLPDERRMLLVTESKKIVYSPDDTVRGHDYRSLGFRAEDAADIDAVLEGAPHLLKEIRSPFFNRQSMAYVREVHVDGAEQKLFLYVDIPADLSIFRPICCTRGRARHGCCFSR